MDEEAVRAWFEGYLSAFAASGRGERAGADVAHFFSAPLLLTTDEVVAWLRTGEEVTSWVQTQADSMVAAKYDHSETLSSDFTILNRNTAVHRASFSRQRADGEEISALTVSYVITGTTGGYRISALVLHAP